MGGNGEGGHFSRMNGRDLYHGQDPALRILREIAERCARVDKVDVSKRYGLFDRRMANKNCIDSHDRLSYSPLNTEAGPQRVLGNVCKFTILFLPFEDVREFTPRHAMRNVGMNNSHCSTRCLYFDRKRKCGEGVSDGDALCKVEIK